MQFSVTTRADMQHSASSIALANRCHRAWWHCYRDKLRPPEIPWLKAKRMKARGDTLPAGSYSRALGTEVHRLAEIYLTTRPSKAARLIDWNDLPGQCLAELVPLLPPAGSVSRKDVESRVSVKVDGVSFRGLVDVVRALEVWDHKTTRDIRGYALLPDAVAQRLNQPKRSLRDDLQACLYALARTSRSDHGALCRWNYTETQRVRRSLPVVQYVPRPHALTVATKAADVARTVEAFATVEDAVPNTLACDQYGGCWWRSEGHCRVPRKWGAVFIQLERETEEQKNMGKLNFKGLGVATAKANAVEETKAKKATKPAPPPEPEETDEEETDEEEEEEAPAPKPSKRRAKVSKRTPVEAEAEEDDDAPESTPAPAPTAKESFNAATAAPDHILQFFGAGSGAKGEAKIVAQAFADLAEHLSNNLPRNPERAQCLRKLLEANDCAVRAASSEA